MAKRSQSNIGIASCSFEIDGASNDVRVLPAGKFRARDGRPTDCPSWFITDKGAQAILAARQSQTDKFLIDYNHQTLYVQQSGQKAPAAGWSEGLQWRPGEGLFACGTEWTPQAKQEIADKSFRYISPVITYNKTSGEVTGLLMASLVNYAALDNLQDLSSLAALQFLLPPSDEDNMNTEILQALGLPDDADDTAVLSAISGLKTESDKVAALSAQLATAQIPDPSKFVPVSAVQELQTQLAALSVKVADSEIDALIKGNLSKLPTPGLQEWARTQTIADLGAYLKNAPEIAALAGMQSKGHDPDKSLPLADRTKKQFETSEALQAEFGDFETYAAFMKADDSGAVKIIGKGEV